MGIFGTRGIVHNRHREMKRSGLFTSSTLRAALQFCALLLLASCSSSEEAIYADSDTPLGSANDSALSENVLPPDSPAVSRPDIVTGPTPANTNREAGLTVGERLKKLDLLMQTAPPDSLGILMAEYERLLDSAMGGPASAEPPGAQPTAQTAQSASTAPSTYPRSTPRSSLNGSGDSRTLVQSDYETSRDSSFDPARFGGIRETELDYYRENTPAPQQVPTPAAASRTGNNATSTNSTANSSAADGSSSRGNTAQATAAKGKGKKKSRTRKGKNGRRNRAVSPQATPPSVAAVPSSPSSKASEPKSAKSSSTAENYTEGLAHFRAGRYQQAVASLKPVANSSGSYRTTAKYYYALSLERTGSLAQAANQFRSLSKGSGTLADKGWLGYCRVLSAQGKKKQAKNELLRLIKQRPQSSQIASAKQMLQQL